MSAEGTPRQKMIGMMYLVLTALLAMNVSKSVLESFVIVNEGLEKTTENFAIDNEKNYEVFEKAAKGKDATKVKPFHDRALEAKKMCAELVKYVDEMKALMVMEAQKIPKEQADTLPLKSVEAKDNYDIPAQILLGPDSENPKSDKFSMVDCKKQIIALREKLTSLFEGKSAAGGELFLAEVKPIMKSKLEAILETKDPRPTPGAAKETWELARVDHVPIAAVVCNLSNIQANIRNAEAEVVNELMKSITAGDFKFDKLVAKVIAPTSYVISGEEYKADVLLVAFNSSSSPRILIGNVDTTKTENENPLLGPARDSLTVEHGLGKYVVRTGGEGEQKYGGVIMVDKPGGGHKYYPFMSSYMVAKPAIVVSPDKMNVFYVGVENPVSISVPGVASENLMPSLSGAGSISGSRGKYIVKVTGGKECTINVGAKSGSGTKSMGAGVPFRVKQLPTPVAFLGGVKEGPVKKGVILASPVVIPKMENFDFDLRITIESFEVTSNVNGDLKTEAGKGATMNEKQLALIKGARNNGRVYIEAIKARMPDGTVRTLPSVNLKVQM
jgi:gliding motility-associated protein GldM